MHLGLGLSISSAITARVLEARLAAFGGAANVRELWVPTEGITQDGGVVSAWQGKVNGNIFSAAGAAQPTFDADAINGRPGLVGNGSSMAMACQTLLLPTPSTSPTFMWIVAIAHAWASNARLVDGWSNQSFACYQAGSSPQIGINNGTGSLAPSSPPIGKPFLVTAEFSSSGTNQYRINNSTRTINCGNNTGTGIRLFRSSSGNYGNYTICELGYGSSLLAAGSAGEQLFYDAIIADYGRIAIPPWKTLVFLIQGQSNGKGYAPGPYYVPSPAVSNASYYNHNGVVVSPIADPTGGPGGQGSFLPRFAERLRQLGITNPLLLVPSCVESTTSTQWLNTYATQALVRLIAAYNLDPANSLIGGVITYQGESDAQNATVAANHASRWGSIYDTFNTFLDGAGLKWAKNSRYTHIELPDTVPSGGSPAWGTAWAAVKTEQQALVAARSDTRSVKPVFAGTDVHIDMASQQALGVALAQDWMDAA